MYTEDAVIECEEGQAKNDDVEIDFEIDLEILEKKSSVQCLCPKCGKNHKLKIFWTGRGTPRIYCHRCRELMASISENAVYESQPDVFRVSKGSISYSEY